MGNLTKRERKAVKKFKSLIARGNHYGKSPNYYSIDEILPESILCEIMKEWHCHDTERIDIPLRVKGV